MPAPAVPICGRPSNVVGPGRNGKRRLSTGRPEVVAFGIS